MVANIDGGKYFGPDCKHVQEGLVVKPLKERWDERLGRVNLKIINPAYLEKN